MNMAREMAALAMANDGAFIGSPTDNTMLSGPQTNGPYLGYSKGPASAALLLGQQQQQQQQQQQAQKFQQSPPQSQQMSSAIYMNSPYVGPTASAGTGRVSPVQYRTSGRCRRTA